MRCCTKKGANKRLDKKADSNLLLLLGFDATMRLLMRKYEQKPQVALALNFYVASA